MLRVVIESPYAGDVKKHVHYARACLRDCFNRDEAGFASHLLYTQEGVLDDDNEQERELGILAGFEYREITHVTAVYLDYGVSKGMMYGINHAVKLGHPVVYRSFLHGLGGRVRSQDIIFTQTDGVWRCRAEDDDPAPREGAARDRFEAFELLRKCYPQALGRTA